MANLREIEGKLIQVGLRNKFWNRSEMRELQRILMSDEEITNAVSGRYQGGFALLISTDKRLLLIDKKLISLSLEDVRYEMIAEVDYFAHMFEATISVITINKSLKFTSLRQSNLRQLTSFVQQRVMELRQFGGVQQTMSLPFTQDPARGYLVPNSGSKPAIQNYQSPQSIYPGTALTVRRRITKFHPSQTV